MAYADIEFYKNKYFGNAVPEDDFYRLSERASDIIDQLTFDRLIDGLPQRERDIVKVKKAVCALAEFLHQIDVYRNSAMEAVGYTVRDDGTIAGKIVTSVSSGSESISYSAGNSASTASAASKAAQDITEERRMAYQIVAPYLQGIYTAEGIPLLYAGIGMRE